tara:strand:- start:1086 stop:1307 length:222 start_codon:yes stop_codon:yes gene_type:complete
MFKKNLAMAILGLFAPQLSAPALPADINEAGLPKEKIKHGKGQLRDTKPKASGAAQLKRAAKKRSNIRKNNKH